MLPAVGALACGVDARGAESSGRPRVTSIRYITARYVAGCRIGNLEILVQPYAVYTHKSHETAWLVAYHQLKDKLDHYPPIPPPQS